MAILKRAMSGAAKSVTMADGSAFTRNWGGISGGMFNHFSSETYASSYPYIRAISSEYMQVLPYAIDGNGEPIDHEIIDALFHPNREDSVVSFAEKTAVSTLTNNKTYILVWRKEKKAAKPGGNFRRDKIAGFTFLERPMVERKDGHTFYKVGTDTYTDQEVLVLPGGVNPANLYAGYSPNEAARRWVKLDDYIADYQAGFFENGAIPAGMFTVTAASDTDYNDTVDALEAKHRGAGKNNNVTYSHRLISDTGSTLANAIEWTPLQQANKDIDFKNLFEQTNRRIEITYGVPGVVMGVDGEAKYDNAEVAEATFAKRAVRPLLLRNYTQMTHELNRITGGFSAAISFDYEVPAIADSEKVKAETKEIESGLILSLTEQGYSLDTIVDAFDLSNSYKLLKKGVEPAVIENDKPEVDEGNEVADSPNPEIVGGNYHMRSAKAVTARQFEDELEDLLPENTGYIMLDTEKLEVLSLVEDSEDDLVDEDDTDFGNTPGENTPHITLLDGVLNQPSEIKDLIDKLYEATPIETITISEVGMFDLKESVAIIAKIEVTDELKELRENFDLVPHASKFSVYTPHVTLAYIIKEADSDKWITALNEEYAGKTLKVTGLNLGSERIEVAKSTNPKAHKTTKATDDELTDEERLENVARKYLDTQVDRVIDDLDGDGVEDLLLSDSPEPTDEELDTFVDEAFVVILSILIAQGLLGKREAIDIASDNGIDIDGIGDFVLSDLVREQYRTYLQRVGISYGSDSAASIRKALAQADIDGLGRDQIIRRLRQIPGLDEYRVKRLAVTELNRSTGLAKIEAFKELAAETGTQWEKGLVHRSTPKDQLCLATVGVYIPLNDTYWQVEGAIVGTEGKVFINDFVNNEGTGVHPNCTGLPDVRLVS